MDDIVTRLRGVLNAYTVEEQQDIVDDAADEIERLRAAGDRLEAALAARFNERSDDDDAAALVAWDEARRG